MVLLSNDHVKTNCQTKSEPFSLIQASSLISMPFKPCKFNSLRSTLIFRSAIISSQFSRSHYQFAVATRSTLTRGPTGLFMDGNGNRRGVAFERVGGRWRSDREIGLRTTGEQQAAERTKSERLLQDDSVDSSSGTPVGLSSSPSTLSFSPVLSLPLSLPRRAACI